ncbi:MAG TPA: hypothetical protein VKV25_04960 [Acidimicrobiales bacterium]|nr:hypothetical protein [Acidimicrobiales bacterium]
MGAGEVVGLVSCWLFVAAVLIWGVLTEGRRRGPGSAPPVAFRLREPTPPVAGHDEWVVVERLAGSGPEVRREGELLAAAALAARGRELRPDNHRVEVATRPGGAETWFLLRREELTPTESR